MKIYVASSWRNEHQQDVVDILISLGHEVYDFKNPPHGNGGFAWSQIDENWEKWTTEDYKKALTHVLAVEGFNSDFDAMKWADCCVMVLPCGRSANTEAGWMKGAGKPVFVYSPVSQEPELMYKIYDGIFSSRTQLIVHFNETHHWAKCLKKGYRVLATIPDPKKPKKLITIEAPVYENIPSAEKAIIIYKNHTIPVAYKDIGGLFAEGETLESIQNKN